MKYLILILFLIGCDYKPRHIRLDIPDWECTKSHIEEDKHTHGTLSIDPANSRHPIDVTAGSPRDETDYKTVCDQYTRKK